MFPLFDALPFFADGKCVRHKSAKGYSLGNLLELRSTRQPPGSSRPPCLLPDPRHRRIQVKANQILTWISLGHQLGARSSNHFPVIVDSGCNNVLTASEWHLRHWANSNTYDFLKCNVVDFAVATVANTPAKRTTPTGKPTQLLPSQLGAIWAQWTNGSIADWLPIIETDLWLSQNEPGERDEIQGPDAWFRLQVRGIMVRPGATARPPLLGLQALQDGRLMVQGQPHVLQRLDIDLQNSHVHLSYDVDPPPPP